MKLRRRWLIGILMGVISVIIAGDWISVLDSMNEKSAIASDLMTERVLSFTQERMTIKSGEPRVVFSRPMSIREFQDAGFFIGNYAPDCDRRYQLVIVEGDFDARGAVPASVAASVPMPAKRIAYILTIPGGEVVGISGDVDGNRFSAFLADPLTGRLPGPPPKFGAERSPFDPSPDSALHKYVPCEDIVVGGPTAP